MISFRKSKKREVVPRRRSERVDDEPRQSGIDNGSQFRRGQTLSGIRQPVDEPLSERAKAHHLAQQRRKIGGIFLLVFIIILVLGGLLTQFTATVHVGGSKDPITRPIDVAPYEKAITDYFGIHPVERLRFVQNQDGLSEYVSALLPEVSRVSLSATSNVVESHYTIAFRHPVAAWQINNNKYFVDESGVVFDQNYYTSPNVKIVDQSGVSPEKGSTVASSRLLSFVGRVVALSRAGGYEVRKVTLPVGTTRQLEIRLKNVRSYVKFSIDRGAGEQVEDMTRALHYLKSKGRSPQYIDVRVAGRTIYQ